MNMGAIMGGVIAAKTAGRREILKALKKANATSPETAKTLNELQLPPTCFNLETPTQAIEYLEKKKQVACVGDKLYLVQK